MGLVIPPGQEQLAESMLGAHEVLPGRCKLDGVAIAQTHLDATYICDGRTLTLELRHVSDSAAGPRTSQFVVVQTQGEAPTGLVDRVVELIRQHEAQWRWVSEQSPNARVPDAAHGNATTSVQLSPTPMPPASPSVLWITPVAVCLFVVALISARSRIRRPDVLFATVLFAVALGLRLVLGPWGPLRVNGLGPMWLDGAISDAGQLSNYGPGYPELFSIVARLFPHQPDGAIFAANCVWSALATVLVFSLAGLAGLDRARSLIAAAIWALDPIAMRVAATESYTSSIIALTLLANTGFAACAAELTAKRKLAAAAFCTGAALAMAQAVRVHPVAWIPAVLAPLAVLMPNGASTRNRMLRGLAAGGVGAGVTFLFNRVIIAEQIAAMRSGALMRPARSEQLWVTLFLVAGCVAVGVRIARPRRPIVVAAPALLAVMLTHESFDQSFVWEQSYERLFLPLPVIALLCCLPRSVLERRMAWLGAVGIGAIGLMASWRFMLVRTTEQLEYVWARDQIAQVPRECLLSYVGEVDNRSMLLPAYSQTGLPPRHLRRIDGRDPADVARPPLDARCAYYMRTSLCASSEGRPVCEAVERALDLTAVARASFPAVPSNRREPYDRDTIETALYRAVGTR